MPEQIHGKLKNYGNAPLHEFEGKNVGIRFARGEFVVCTNQGKKEEKRDRRPDINSTGVR